MSNIPLIYDDQRQIDAIWFPGEDASGWCVSSKAPSYACEKIVAYPENGQMAPVPFFAVYRQGQIVARVPAQMVEVRYTEGGAA